MATLEGDADTQSNASAAVWTNAATDVIDEILEVQEMIETQDLGYDGFAGGTLVLHTNRRQDFLNNAGIRAALPRESQNGQIQSGVVAPILGLDEIIFTPRITSTVALLIDSDVAGTVMDEIPDPEEGWQTFNLDPPVDPVYVMVNDDKTTKDKIVAAGRWLVFFDGDLDMVIRASTFERCAVLGILFDVAGGAANDVGYKDITVDNNFFGYILEPYDHTGTCCVEAGTSQRNLIFKQERVAQTITMEDILIRYSTFKHGLTTNHLSTTQTYTNVRVIGNLMGKASACESAAGLTYNRNVWLTGSAGCGETSFLTTTWGANSLLAVYSEGSSVVSNTRTHVSNFHLGTGPYSLENWITETTSDHALTTDRDGDARTSGSRDAGADER